MKKHPAVFFDRDGTLIDERKYLTDPKRLRLYPSTANGLRRLKAAGFKIVVVTNQSAVGRGYLTEARLGVIHTALRAALKTQGAVIDAIYFCPHLPEAGCGCRKPGTVMPKRAARELNIDLKRSFVVGDQLRDVDLARNIGARGILVLTGAGRSLRKKATGRADKITSNAGTAATWILINSVKSPRP